jgi:multidrug transporter EmrE-like cation transporter
MSTLPINWRTLAYGLSFGALDATALPVVKAVSKGANPAWMIVPVLLYGASPFLLLSALRQETLTIMNLVWDLTSDVVVTFIGLIIFGETISPVKGLGVAASFIALTLMSYENHALNDFLTRNYRALTNTTNRP